MSLSRLLLIPGLLAISLTACDQPAPAPHQQDTAIPVAEALPVLEEAVPVTGSEGSDYLLLCPADYEKAEGFPEFLARLQAAVAQKDAAFIAAIAADDIKFDFGGGYGKADFLAEWQLDATPEDSPIWQELEAMLELNGYVVQGTDVPEGAVIFPCTFRMPPVENWMFAANPELDGFDYVVVTARDAELKDNHGDTFRPLTYGETLLRVKGAQDRFTTHDGLEGTVDESAIRSPLDYRVFFHKQGDTWVMPIFIAGD